MNKRTYYTSLLSLLLFVLIGCAGPTVSSRNREPYVPKADPGLTLDGAIQDLTRLLAKGDPVMIEFTPPQMFASYEEMTEVGNKGLQTGAIFQGCADEELRSRLKWLEVKSFPVYDDRIFIPFGAPLYFDQLPTCPPKVYGSKVEFCNKLAFLFEDSNVGDARKFADRLVVIKEQLEKQNALFAQLAAEYRSLAVKPQVSEKQRRLIVKANLLTQQKSYRQAIAQYEQVIAFHPTAYPAAYYNAALLSAQEERYGQAIRYMRHYLALVPDAKDVRSAQDKIYEWELKMESFQQK